MDNNSLSTLLIGASLYCVLMVALLAVIGYVLFRRMMNFVRPDVSNMQQEFDKARVRAPSLDDEAIMRRLIARQAVRSGLIGAITSVGGFITLPITLPVDLLLSTQVHKSLVEFIAARYGKTTVTRAEAELRTYLVVSGGLTVSEAGSRLVLRAIGRVFGKSLAKIVPLFGAIVGFIVNYSVAQATGRLALQWYSGKFTRKQLP